MAGLAFHCFSRTIDIPVGLRHQPLQASWISTRLKGLFYRAGVRVLGDLHGRKVADFAWERNCGVKTLRELDSLARIAESGAQSAFALGTGTLRRPGSAIPATAAWFAIPESVCPLHFHELPITTRLANVLRSIGARTLGDLNECSSFELLQCKACGWRTLGEIQRLIERAVSGEFDEGHIDDSAVAAELLTLLEQGMAKLSPRERQFLLARIGGEDLPSLSLAEIGRRSALTRARVHRVVASAVDKLRKTWGPRVPRLLEMIKHRCLWMVCPLTPALLEQWMGDCSERLRLSRKAHLRLIAALDENIPCWLEKHDNIQRVDESTYKLDRDLADLARAAGGYIAVAKAYSSLIGQPYYRKMTVGEFLRMLRRVRRTEVEFKNPQLPVVRLCSSNGADLRYEGQEVSSIKLNPCSHPGSGHIHGSTSHRSGVSTS